MPDDYKEKGELAILRKKYTKLSEENKTLQQRIRAYKDNEHKRIQKESKKHNIYKSIHNLPEIKSTKKHDMDIIETILERELSFHVFKHYASNDHIFNKFSHFFLENYPVQILSYLRNRDITKFRNQKLQIFIKKHVNLQKNNEWNGWFLD